MAEDFVEQKVKRLEEWRNNFFCILQRKYLLDETDPCYIPRYDDKWKCMNEKLAKAQADLHVLVNWDATSYQQCMLWKQKSWEVLTYEDGHYNSSIWSSYRGLKDVVHGLLHIASSAMKDLIVEFFTTEQLLQYFGKADKDGEKYLFSTGILRRRVLLRKLVCRLDEQSAFDLLNTRSKDGQTALFCHHWPNETADDLMQILQTLNSAEKYLASLLTVRDDGEPMLFSVWPGPLNKILSILTITERHTVMSLKDTSGKNILHMRGNLFSPKDMVDLLDLLSDDEYCFNLVSAKDNCNITPLFHVKADTMLALLGRFETQQRRYLINIADDKGRTALHSSRFEQPAVTRELLVLFESKEFCYQLFSARDNNGKTPLFSFEPSAMIAALSQFDSELCFQLIGMRDNKGRNIFHNSWRLDALAISELFTFLRSDDRCFQLLAMQDDTGKTPLFYFGVNSVVATLSRFSLEEQISLLEIIDNEGSTPLHVYRYEKISQPHFGKYMEQFTTEQWFKLLALQNNVGQTPLFYWHSPSVITALSKLTNDQQMYLIDTRNHRGQTFLHNGGCSAALLVTLLNSLNSDAQRFQILSSYDEDENTILHIVLVCFSTSEQYIDALKTISDPYLRLNLVTKKNKEGRTVIDQILNEMNDYDYDDDLEYMRQYIQAHIKCIDALWMSRTEARIEILQTLCDSQDQDEIIGDMIREDPLTPQQIQSLTPLSRRYIIPLNQRKSFYLSFIFYNTESRENGAEAEVESLRSAFDDTGFTVFKDKWTHVDQLQEYVGCLLSMPVIHEECTFLFACIMSHGKLGQLCGSESSSVPINTIIRLFRQNMPSQIPLVLMIQACQNSEVGAFSDHLNTDAPPFYSKAEKVSDSKNIVLTRENTILLLASSPGGVAYRGAYTGELANQIKQAQESNISIHEIHENAVIEMGQKYGPGQTPMCIHTLKKKLFMPIKGKPS